MKVIMSNITIGTVDLKKNNKKMIVYGNINKTDYIINYKRIVYEWLGNFIKIIEQQRVSGYVA